MPFTPTNQPNDRRKCHRHTGDIFESEQVHTFFAANSWKPRDYLRLINKTHFLAILNLTRIRSFVLIWSNHMCWRVEFQYFHQTHYLGRHTCWFISQTAWNHQEIVMIALIYANHLKTCWHFVSCFHRRPIEWKTSWFRNFYR